MLSGIQQAITMTRLLYLWSVHFVFYCLCFTQYIVCIMAKKIIRAIIERASDGGYGIYCPDLDTVALFGYGLTEKEAKENLLENLDAHIEFYDEENKPMPPALNNGEIEFDYSYDFSGFFKSYPMFNVSELAKFLDINPSLLRRYKQRLAFASTEQKKKIEQGIQALAGKLGTVRF